MNRPDPAKIRTAEKLEAERLKLIQAHYADAIPLELMKNEQARITTNLDGIKRRLNNLSTTYAEAREGLDQLADLITDLGDLYLRCEPSARQILLRAVVKKIVIDEEENISYKPTKVVNAAKTYATSQISADSAANEGGLNDEVGMQKGEVSNFSLLVDLRGLEPLTPCMPCRCATNCATDPFEVGGMLPRQLIKPIELSRLLANWHLQVLTESRRSLSRAFQDRSAHDLPREKGEL